MLLLLLGVVQQLRIGRQRGNRISLSFSHSLFVESHNNNNKKRKKRN